MKAIVIEDEVITNKHICQLLNNISIETIGYTNSIEALENIKEYDPDVLFLDIEMPEMD